MTRRWLEKFGVRFFVQDEGGTATMAPPVIPGLEAGETAIQYRDRLRQVVIDRGGDPLTIETIAGNCDQQVATQTRDYQNWLAAH